VPWRFGSEWKTNDLPDFALCESQFEWKTIDLPDYARVVWRG
jgi:hypothetical protein